MELAKKNVKAKAEKFRVHRVVRGLFFRFPPQSGQPLLAQLAVCRANGSSLVQDLNNVMSSAVYSPHQPTIDQNDVRMREYVRRSIPLMSSISLHERVFAFLLRGDSGRVVVAGGRPI